jgi:DnaJ-class molecular chaperone
MITSQKAINICSECKGNGFKWLDIPNLITEPCKTCNNTGEVQQITIQSVNQKDTYVNERGL